MTDYLSQLTAAGRVVERTREYQEWQKLDACHGIACDQCQFLKLCSDDPDCRADAAITELSEGWAKEVEESAVWKMVAERLVAYYCPDGQAGCDACLADLFTEEQEERARLSDRKEATDAAD